MPSRLSFRLSYLCIFPFTVALKNIWVKLDCRNRDVGRPHFRSGRAVVWLRLQLWNAPASVCHYWVSILSPRAPGATHGDHDAISTVRLFFSRKNSSVMWQEAVRHSCQSPQQAGGSGAHSNSATELRMGGLQRGEWGRKVNRKENMLVV